MMGFDEWGDGMAKDDYLALCRSSEKYRKGTWYAFGDAGGEPVASVIAYQLALASPTTIIGLGSIATKDSKRRQGIAYRCLEALMGAYQSHHGVDAFLLFADRETTLYDRLGFRPLPAELQRVPETTAMVCYANRVSAESVLVEGLMSGHIRYF